MLNLFNDGNCSKEIKKEKAKIVFQFALMLVSSVVCGVCLSRLLSEATFVKIGNKIQLYFSCFFDGCNKWQDYMSSFLPLNFFDVLCVLILFIFSFSFLNYIVSDIIIILCGFSFGINLSVFCAFFSQIGISSSLLYLICKFLILILISSYAWIMALYSLHLRRFTGNGRAIINKRTLLLVSVLTLTVLGTILMINALYCAFIILLN